MSSRLEEIKMRARYPHLLEVELREKRLLQDIKKAIDSGEQVCIGTYYLKPVYICVQEGSGDE